MKIMNDSTRIWYNFYFRKKYILRMQSLNFLIVIDKETGEYKNLYATDTKEGREYLAYIAEQLTKHPAIDDSIRSERITFGYVNDITKYLDKYLIKADGCSDMYVNYLFTEKIRDNWPIRVPGKTVGHIAINDNDIITDIVLYEDSFCYDRKVLDNLKQFKGRALFNYESKKNNG